MLHPVGELPAGVYWRRRALVLGIALSVAGGGGWLAASVGSGTTPVTPAASSDSAAEPSLDTPSLEQVVPSLAAVQTPAEQTPLESAPVATETAPPPVAPAAGPVEGQACTDDMLAVDVVPAAPQAAVGTKPTFTLVVTNIAGVSCTRSLDAGLREVVLLDAAGTRVWGSNDCFPERSSEPRTLAAGEAVSFPVQWGGLTSEPTCTVTRANPPAGAYQLQGRLDTKVGGATPFTLV
ncbi:MucR family transcriptional regulator [Klenkia terrae]|uniref:MucR family transcriptional regulator n=1 Tax=Klenkia terrae TaxID=1052259 RepID=A0ABU8E024_9ACTN|nr:MucR family transcriptional regulator [Klenkia terrae]